VVVLLFSTGRLAPISSVVRATGRYEASLAREPAQDAPDLVVQVSSVWEKSEHVFYLIRSRRPFTRPAPGEEVRVRVGQAANAAIEASVCPLVGTSAPHADDEHAIVGRTGVLARMETSRRYYFFCVEGHERLALYRREDGRYTMLGGKELAVDASRYYRLRLDASGNRLRAECDGEPIADVFDPVLRRGPVGVRKGEPVNWRGDGEELVFIGTSPQAFGLWNAHGQKVVALDGIASPARIADVLGDPRDEYVVQTGGKVMVYTQDRPAPDPNRVYAPVRHKRLGHPRVSYPNWAS
jgi:hypothetical protein